MPTGVYKRIEGKKHGGFQKGHSGYKTWLGKSFPKEVVEKMRQAKLGLRDENTSGWKGDKVSKSGLHNWVYKKLGYPNKCVHCGFESENHKKIHWANKSHKYKRELSDWLRLCVPCHRKYDMTPKKLKMYRELMKKNAEIGRKKLNNYVSETKK